MSEARFQRLWSRGPGYRAEVWGPAYRLEVWGAGYRAEVWELVTGLQCYIRRGPGTSLLVAGPQRHRP